MPTARQAWRLAGGLAAVWGAALALNRSLRRVTGPSMEPTLREGDLLLVVPAALRRPRVGDVVVAADPRDPARATVKRLARRTGDGRAVLRGDNPGASTDSRTFGPVPATAVTAVAVARVWPPRPVRGGLAPPPSGGA